MLFLRRLVFVFLGACALAGFMSAPAAANSKYAAYVMHADTGDVLFSRYATSYRYPASLTKVMTLYLLFEAIEAGDVSLTDEFKVSKRAAGQPPSKLGVRAGSTIDVETAIHALVVRSANDVAVVVAENLAGSEWKFAQQMTAKARKIGMRRTTFRNASGLPNSRQRSTARDLAIMSQRTMQDFPQYYDYFNAKSFQWKGRTYRTHNRIVLYYKGATGLKTGYTRASGYNLATTAERKDHKLIGIVLGGRSGKTRDAHMRKILDQAYAKIDRNPGVLKSFYANRPAPSLKPTLLARLEQERQQQLAAAAPALTVTAAAAPEAASPVQEAEDPIRALIKRMSETPAASDADGLNQSQALAVLAGMAGLPQAEEEGPLAQGDAIEEAVAEISPPPLWSVQIGAYKSAELAASKLKRASQSVGGALKDAGRAVAPYVQGGKTLYRARFTGFTEEEAQNACAAAKRKKYQCFAIAENDESA